MVVNLFESDFLRTKLRAMADVNMATTVYDIQWIKLKMTIATC